MPSDAKTAFTRALADVENLIWFHENEGGLGQGRRPAHFQSLNKSAVVLLCASWEIYIEMVILECAERSIAGAATPHAMLKSLQKLVQAHVRTGKVENAWQSVAGEGWKDLARSMAKNRVAALNTPKPGPVTELMDTVLGVDDIKTNWSWKNSPDGVPAQRLLDFVTLRGSIAHGEQLDEGLTKARVQTSQRLIVRLVNCVEAKLLAEHLLPA